MIKQWIFSVTAAAMLAALAEHMTPPGPVKKIGRLIQGLVLFFVVVQPVLGLDYGAAASALSQWRLDGSGYESSVETGSFFLMQRLIEEKTAAYIQDKAAQRGIDCRVEIVCSAEDAQSYPYPAQATVWGSFTPKQKEELSRLIEGDVAIPPSSQFFEEEGVEPSCSSEERT